MADVGSLLVRIGADASSYMATTSRVKTQTSQLFGAMRGAVRGLSDQFTDVFGIKMPAALMQAQRGMEFFATGAQTMGNKLKWTTDVAKFSGGQIALFAEGAFRAGLAIGHAIEPWVSAVTGLEEATARMGPAQAEFVESLAASEPRYRTQLELYNRMREQLGLVGDQWTVAADHTQENSERLARLTEELRKHAHQLRFVEQAQRQVNTVTLTADQITRRIRDAIVAQDRAIDGTTQSLQEMYGVMDRGDATTAIERLLNDFALLAKSGVDAGQLMTAFGERVQEVAGKAEQLGMVMPAEFEELRWAIGQAQEGTNYYLQQTAQHLASYIPEAADEAAAALRSSMGVLGGAIREADGTLTNLGRTLDQIAGQSYEVRVRVRVDTSELDELRDRGVVP